MLSVYLSSAWSSKLPQRRRGAKKCRIADLPPNATLTEMGLCSDTDKSFFTQYTQFYPLVLERFRSQTFDMIEIGVASEGSLKMWDTFFPLANV